MKRLVIAVMLLFVMGCGGQPNVIYSPEPQKTDTQPVAFSKSFVSIGYAIQAGAFRNPQNATRLTLTLQKEGLDAYYFVHESGLYKVRFGDFPSKALATENAEALHARGILDVYYVVGPEDYPTAEAKQYGDLYIREEIVKTAERFLGIPYQWGGTSPETGFDCSGLTSAVYELNGLKLPRSSTQQWLVGTPVGRHDLSKADLVFFATAGGKRVSHVGIYVEQDKFIHAPRKGKTIRFGSLTNRYFKRHFLGARTYL